MNRSEFESLVLYAKMAVPEGVEDHVSDLPKGISPHLMAPGFFDAALKRQGVPDGKAALLKEALKAIEDDQRLLRLSQALREDAHRALNRQTACDFEEPHPRCLNGFSRDAYPLLFALSCLEHGLEELKKRGIPEEKYLDTVWRMADKQLKLYADTGTVTIADYSWDMNFYCCAIFLMDRFYFTPYRWEGPGAWRCACGTVRMLWEPGVCVRADGQLDGVNGIKDPEAFVTVWQEDRVSITANGVNPVGIIRREPLTLMKAQWQQLLAKDDMLLALHIPGGEGYTPERVKRSMLLALEFYDRYFPEIPVKGFWSESWLYDPGLMRVLPLEGRIISVQRQFYNYPTMEGDGMLKLEVFGDEDIPLEDMKTDTGLQKKVVESFKNGVRYHTSGMFVLREDTDRIGTQPYVTEDDIREYLG